MAKEFKIVYTQVNRDGGVPERTQTYLATVDDSNTISDVHDLYISDNSPLNNFNEGPWEFDPESDIGVVELVSEYNNANNESSEGLNDISTTTDPSVNTPNTSTGQAIRQEETQQSFSTHITWDPRLYRYDEFFEIKDNAGNAIRAPFASDTIASAFGDLSNVAEAGVMV